MIGSPPVLRLNDILLYVYPTLSVSVHPYLCPFIHTMANAAVSGTYNSLSNVLTSFTLDLHRVNKIVGSRACSILTSEVSSFSFGQWLTDSQSRHQCERSSFFPTVASTQLLSSFQ